MPLILPWLLSNWQLIVKGIGIALLAFAAWFYFVHNPKVIKELELEKAELARMIEAKNAQITLYGDIEKGKVVITNAVHQQISTLRSTGRPKRTVIIRAGRVLPPLSKASPAAN